MNELRTWSLDELLEILKLIRAEVDAKYDDAGANYDNAAKLYLAGKLNLIDELEGMLITGDIDI